VSDWHFIDWKVKGRKYSNLPTRDMRNRDKVWPVVIDKITSSKAGGKS
jgi:hypothetical protein